MVTHLRAHPRDGIAAGFAFIALLALVATIGIVSAGSLQMGAILERRMAEQELLAIGLEIQNALTSYASATPVGMSPYPASMQDLLRDPRYPGVRRHLRKIYVDPMTGLENWDSIAAPVGSGIAGFASYSEKLPIKSAGFISELHALEGAKSYRDWKFIGFVTPRR